MARSTVTPEVGTEFTGLRPGERRTILRVHAIYSVGPEVQYGVVADDRNVYRIALSEGRWQAVMPGTRTGPVRYGQPEDVDMKIIDSTIFSPPEASNAQNERLEPEGTE